MPTLRELEERAYRAILFADTDCLAPYVVGDDIPAESRIQVYQNNAREGFARALAASYPVVAQLVGEACFDSLAYQYMRRHPSRSGDLQRYGCWFPSYLQVCYGESEYDYLVDVARLEWACEEVRTAPEAGSLDVGALARISNADYPGLCFCLHPAHQVVSSRYPVLSIWQANIENSAASIDLRDGGEHVLVTRQKGDVELHRWPAALAVYTRAVGDGESLADAVALATGVDPGFDPADAMLRLAGLGLLSGFHLQSSNLAE